MVEVGAFSEFTYYFKSNLPVNDLKPGHFYHCNQNFTQIHENAITTDLFWPKQDQINILFFINFNQGPLYGIDRAIMEYFLCRKNYIIEFTDKSIAVFFILYNLA